MDTVRPIAFYGIDCAAITAFNNTDMIREGISIPVVEYDFTGGGAIASILPEIVRFEPGFTKATSGKLGEQSFRDQTILISNPGDEYSAPFYPVGKAIPGPIGFTTHLTELRTCHLHHPF